MLPEVYGADTMKKSCVFLCNTKGSKRASMSKSQMKTILISSSLSSILRILFSLNSFNKAKMVTTLIMWKL